MAGDEAEAACREEARGSNHREEVQPPHNMLFYVNGRTRPECRKRKASQTIQFENNAY